LKEDDDQQRAGGEKKEDLGKQPTGVSNEEEKVVQPGGNDE
jgi:hypothetical protein